MNAGPVEVARLINRDLKRWGIAPVLHSDGSVWFAEEVPAIYSAGGVVAHYKGYRLLFPLESGMNIYSVLWSRIQNQNKDEIRARHRKVFDASQKEADEKVEEVMEEIRDELKFAAYGKRYF